jgi:dihydropteroate synthase
MMHQPRFINCKGLLIDLSKPKVMGILNITPDSFYDGGKYLSQSAILKQVELMLHEGADFIDVGGASSRPGASLIDAETEWKRIADSLKCIIKQFPKVLLSVDTVHSEVARRSADEGVAMINDISAGTFDDKMIGTVAELQMPYIMMHMKGTPDTMQQNISYTDLMTDIITFLGNRIDVCRKAGIHDLIVDPGFGFGKTIQHNFELLSKLSLLKITGLPLMVGLSRKSMIYKTLNITAEEALSGTTALHLYALEQGACILRVHDVKEAVQCIKLYHALNKW